MSLFSSFLRKKTVFENPVFVDIHSHFIPGIDDGVKTEDESLELLSGLFHLGYKKVVTTPHIYQGVFNNSYETILPGLERMREVLKQNSIGIELEAAAEYFFDDYFLKCIQEENLLTFGDNYVLFELSSNVRPRQLEDAVFELKLKGYKPVLAHPERYNYFHEPKLDSLEKLKGMELLFQMNALALNGFYNNTIMRVARQLIKNEWIDWVGSDMHNMRYLESFRDALEDEYYEKLCATGNLLNNTLIEN